MANKEHLARLKEAIERKDIGIWNKWRLEHLDIIPDLSRADLSKAKLAGAFFLEANLSGANLTGADLANAKLLEADLSKAKLTRADLTNANLSRTNLLGADLSRANLTNANLSRADLTNAILTGAELYIANLTKANLTKANFTGVFIASGSFANVDLSESKGLHAVFHMGPSTIGIDTIYQSKGKIPEAFLRGAGVPDNFIEYMHSLTGEALQFYSCFISHSSKDQKFAERLHADLRAKGVRCWFAPEDLKIGDKIRPRIDESILMYDKLLLIISKTAIASQWIEQEVETALAKEREQNRKVLFPIRLDDAVMKIPTGWPALIKNTRHIGNFTTWKDHDSYRRDFDRLLRDLKAEGK